MKRITSFGLAVGILLSSNAAFSGDDACSAASRAASKAAQDYRNAVGKVRTACDSSLTDCAQRRAEADEILDTVVAANETVLLACRFTDAAHDDSLPVTAETVAAAIDSLPEAILMSCNVVDSPVGPLQFGCPGGWLLNLQETNLLVSTAATTSFNYSLNLNASGAVPVVSSLLGSCTLSVGTPTAIPIAGTATFSSSSEGGTFNRLQLAVTELSLNSVGLSGCSLLSSILDLYFPLFSSSLEAAIESAVFARQFCGATGPEVFGPCP